MPLTICKCLALLLRSHTKKTANEADSVDMPMSTKMDVVRLIDCSLSSRSSSLPITGSGALVSVMLAVEPSAPSIALCTLLMATGTECSAVGLGITTTS